MNWFQKYVVGELAQSEQFNEGISALSAHNNVSVARLPGSALSLFVAALAKYISRPICLITSHAERAEQVYDDLEFFGLSEVYHFAEDENLPYEFDEPSIEILAKQIETYAHLASVTAPSAPESGALPTVIIASLESVLRKSVTLKTLNEHTETVRISEIADIERMSSRLHNAGYVRVPIVETRGEYAVRGGIVDVFPLNSDLPFRLDLFGNQIEAIRYFDPSTQRSLKKDAGKQATFPPAKKNLLILRSP